MPENIKRLAQDTIASYRRLVTSQYGSPPPEPTQATARKTAARENASAGVEEALQRARQVQDEIRRLREEET